MTAKSNPLATLALALVVIGGVNWGLVALAEFDLVAWLFGEEFGATNAITRIVYGLVGLAAAFTAVSMLGGRREHAGHGHASPVSS